MKQKRSGPPRGRPGPPPRRTVASPLAENPAITALGDEVRKVRAEIERLWVSVEQLSRLVRPPRKRQDLAAAPPTRGKRTVRSAAGPPRGGGPSSATRRSAGPARGPKPSGPRRPAASGAARASHPSAKGGGARTGAKRSGPRPTAKRRSGGPPAKTRGRTSSRGRKR